jgi:magnesium-transporting ATPase (P-type)
MILFLLMLRVVYCVFKLDSKISVLCTNILFQEVFKAAIDDMAASSLRCVAIAYRSYELDKVPTDEEHLAQWVLPEDGLVLLAIVGIKVNIKK